MKSLRGDLLLAATAGLMLGHLLIDIFSRHLEMKAPTGLVMTFDVAALFLAILAYVRRRTGRISKQLEAERQRMARDLHDGVGFQLSTALLLARDAKDVADDLRMAIELAIVELHSAVHLTQSHSVSILDAMANLRYRIQPALEWRGLQLIWQVDEAIPEDVLAGPAAPHFIRVVQEALSNVLHHAHATQLVVRLGCPPPGRVLLLEVMDNGRGLASAASGSAANRPGRGLASMKLRADQIGAVLQLSERREGGTRISLAVPLPCGHAEMRSRRGNRCAPGGWR